VAWVIEIKKAEHIHNLENEMHEPFVGDIEISLILFEKTLKVGLTDIELIKK